jgi:acyl-coenzyme A synthetase/AMP-(fatty) acid ligase
MPQKNETVSLAQALGDTAQRPQQLIWGAHTQVALTEVAAGSSLACEIEELRARSVLILTREQLTAALALIQIDGVARRLILCPPDLDIAQLPFVMATAEVDVVVSDYAPGDIGVGNSARFVSCGSRTTPADAARGAQHATEWVLFTSGTSGAPKMVSHGLTSLAGAINASGGLAGANVWSTFYDIRRYGGLQIFLRALLGGGSLVLSDAEESTAAFLSRAGSHAVTHLTGTPSHWRRALMSGAAARLALLYVRLSGEIADQAILDSLRAQYPRATIAHAFASTEAGVGFEVEDGLAGIPASYFAHAIHEVDLKVESGSLRIRSPRTARHYLGREGVPLIDADGFVDTGDILELRDARYYFSGRRGGIINVGGLKVHPEEVEAVINRHPRVQMSLVKSRKNPVTGAIVVAEIVLKPQPTSAESTRENAAVKSEILESCHRALAAHKVPAAIHIVPSLEVTPSGKVARPNA